MSARGGGGCVSAWGLLCAGGGCWPQAKSCSIAPTPVSQHQGSTPTCGDSPGAPGTPRGALWHPTAPCFRGWVQCHPQLRVPHGVGRAPGPHALLRFQGRQSLPGPPGRPLAHGAGAPQAPVPGARPDPPPGQQHPQQQRRPPPPPGGLLGPLPPTYRARPRSCKSLCPLGPGGGTDCNGRKPSRPGWDCSVPSCPCLSPLPCPVGPSLVSSTTNLWAVPKCLRLPSEAHGCILGA